MQYIAYINQTDYGCDYTIACGKVMRRLNAQTREDALKEIRQFVFGEGGGWVDVDLNLEIEDITLFEVSEEIDIPLERWLEEYRTKVNEEAADALRNAELRQLAKLKAKYE